MSEVRVNKLSPRSGTTVTLGDSGDTITIPSGVTLANSGTIDNLNASNLTSGTVPDARITGAYTGITNLTMSGDLVTGGDISTGNNGVLNILDGDGDISGKLANQSSSAHSLEIIADPSNSGANSNMMFKIDNSEKMRIDSSGNVGIGTSSPNNQLEIKSDTATVVARLACNSGTGRDYGVASTTDGSFGIYDYDAAAYRMRIDSSGNVGIGTTSPDTSGSRRTLQISNGINGGTIFLNDIGTGSDNPRLVGGANGTSSLYIAAGGASGIIGFETGNATERMRIDSSGHVLIGKTSTSSAVAGVRFAGDSAGLVEMTRNGGQPLNINRMTNDGTLVAFYQNDVTEGTISVSGTTVSYNGFTGTHWSRFQDNSTPTILKGTVLETLDEMCDWYNLEFDIITQDENGNDVTTPQKIPHVLVDGQSDGDVITYNYEGTDYQATIVKEGDIKHMKSKVSDTVDAKNVYGVFVAYDNDGDGYNDFYVASVGSFVVRIKANETIAKGDLLQSNGDGTAKVQTDDNVKSSSFAKVLSTTIIETYEDGSYLVPCSLMC